MGRVKYLEYGTALKYFEKEAYALVPVLLSVF